MKTTHDIRTDFENIYNEIAQLQLGKEQNFQLALSILEEFGRYNRGAEAANSRTNGNGNGNDKPPTEKQIKFLQDLGIKNIPATSKEASVLIEEHSNKKGRFPARSPFPK